jgi:hypothetical protein
MFQLGYEDDRLEDSLETLADEVVRLGFRCRFNAPSPRPVRMAEGLPCAWGATKVLGAFAEIPDEHRSPEVRAAVQAGVALLLGGDPSTGDYPTASRPSPRWHRLGFPLGFTSDMAEALDVLGRLGAPRKPALDRAARALLGKRDENGRWKLEHTPGRGWSEFGQLGKANKWVTLRALAALKAWGTWRASSQPRGTF